MAKKSKAKTARKRGYVRISFRPLRAPKWWPRDGRKIQYVGVTCEGFGWALGEGDKIPAARVDDVLAILQSDYGLIAAQVVPV